MKIFPEIWLIYPKLLLGFIISIKVGLKMINQKVCRESSEYFEKRISWSDIDGSDGTL